MKGDLLLFLLIGSVILSVVNLVLVALLLIPRRPPRPWPLPGDNPDEDD